MIYKFLKVILIYFVISINFVLANEINNLNVSGNQRISKETIQVLGAIEFNKEYTSENINQILKNLYSTDFFEDIKIEVKDKTLSIKVKENPIIQNVIITGIKKEEFKNKLLETISLKNRSSFTDYKLQNDLNLLNNILKQNGFILRKLNLSKKK